MKFAGHDIETDTEGYLKSPADWSEALAEEIATSEGITLTEAHWQVVRFVREFYLEFNTSPGIRMLVKAMAKSSVKRKATAVICSVCFLTDLQSRQQK